MFKTLSTLIYESTNNYKKVPLIKKRQIVGYLANRHKPCVSTVRIQRTLEITL